MSAPALSARDRRVLLFGGCAMAAILLLGRAVPALVAHARERERSASVIVARAARAAWLARNAPALQRALARSREELARHRAAFVAGTTSSGASANLAELVSDAVAATDARLTSIRSTSDSSPTPGDVERVVVHASITGDLLSLATVLQTLEQGPRVLVVSQLSVSSAQPAIATNQREQLQAELVVDGLHLVPPAERSR